MRAHITEGIVTSTTFLLVAVLFTIMVAGCGITSSPPVSPGQQPPTSGPPSYADPLNNPASPKTQGAQWDGLDGNDGNCIFESDGYHIRQSSGGLIGLNGSLYACKEATYQYEDATIFVNINILKGDSGGLFFHFSTGPIGNYIGYLFEFNSGGNYKLSGFRGDTLQDWTPSSALKTGYGVTNTLAVVIKGNTFDLYANGANLTKVTDNNSSDLHPTGYIALFASAPQDNTEVVFSNLKVYQMS